ncbi:MAG: hypothetical protein DRR19_07865 [Candidatus Parabeggiatoa sp. nov. 1]|nr:MAG: hypothetical protein DRR19_07865 [Gammaproteobacteria bacterium]
MADNLSVVPENWPQVNQIVSKAIARCWLDEAFKADFIDNPRSILEGEGLSFPEGVSVTVDQNSTKWTTEPLSPGSQKMVISIPLPPRPAEITVEELKNWLDDQGDAPRCVPVCSC